MRTCARSHSMSLESVILPPNPQTEFIELGATLRNLPRSASRPVSMAMLSIVKAKSSSALKKSITIFWHSLSIVFCEMSVHSSRERSVVSQIKLGICSRKSHVASHVYLTANAQELSVRTRVNKP